VEEVADPPPPGATDADPPRRVVRSVLVDQAAALLGVSRRTVYYRIRDGRLRTIRTRCGSQRVLMDSVEEVLRDELRKRARRKAR
jgi:excisionase family DNA binding protein